MREWKEFELLIARIQEQTAPYAKVRHNHRVKGKSGHIRQLDVTIDQKVGLHTVFIVIECKNYKRPVTLDKVEAFVTKLGDVKASRGVMVSVKGFDSGARDIAAQHGIVLQTMREASEADWYGIVTNEPILKMVVMRLEHSRTGLVIEPRLHEGVVVNSLLTLYNEAGQAVMTLAELQELVLKQCQVPSKTGPTTVVSTINGLYVILENHRYVVNRVIVEGVTKELVYDIPLRLGTGHVLETAPGREIIYQELTSESWDTREILRQVPRDFDPSEIPSTGYSSIVLEQPYRINSDRPYGRLVVRVTPNG